MARRAGLNIAALLCQDCSITETCSHIVKVHRSFLDDAYAAGQGRYRSLHGNASVDRHSRAMTILEPGAVQIVNSANQSAATIASKAGTVTAMLPRLVATGWLPSRAITTPAARSM